jgi:hypothetical protein
MTKRLSLNPCTGASQDSWNVTYLNHFVETVA